MLFLKSEDQFPVRQHDLRIPRSIGQPLQQISDQRHSGAAFVVRSDDGPGRELVICLQQHSIPRFGVLIPFFERAGVDRAVLPLRQWILLAFFEPSLLLVAADVQIVFEQKPITFSTPARLYQLRLKTTNSIGAGRCGT